MLMQDYKSILSRVGSLIASNQNQEDVNLKQQNKNVGVDRKLMSKIAEKKREQWLNISTNIVI